MSKEGATLVTFTSNTFCGKSEQMTGVVRKTIRPVISVAVTRLLACSVHSCSRHGVVAASFTSSRPGSLVALRKIFSLLYVHCFIHVGFLKQTEKGLVVRALCFSSYQTASSPLRLQLASRQFLDFRSGIVDVSVCLRCGASRLVFKGVQKSLLWLGILYISSDIKRHITWYYSAAPFPGTS
jgi:hypothetical protein